LPPEPWQIIAKGDIEHDEAEGARVQVDCQEPLTVGQQFQLKNAAANHSIDGAQARLEDALVVAGYLDRTDSNIWGPLLALGAQSSSQNAPI
jgi:hypothetical protein